MVPFIADVRVADSRTKSFDERISLIAAFRVERCGSRRSSTGPVTFSCYPDRVLPSATHRAWSAGAEAFRVLTLLLAVLVFMASVDRLPDPPAAKSNYTQYKISSSPHQAASLGAPCARPLALFRPAVERCTDRSITSSGDSNRLLLLQRSTDSSPPTLDR